MSSLTLQGFFKHKKTCKKLNFLHVSDELQRNSRQLHYADLLSSTFKSTFSSIFCSALG